MVATAMRGTKKKILSRPQSGTASSFLANNNITAKKVTVALVVLLLVWLLPGRMVMNRRSTYLHDAAKKDAQTAVVKQNVADARQVVARPAYYNQQLKAINQAIPATYSLPGIIRVFSQLATQSGVVWVTGSPAASVDGGITPPAGLTAQQITVEVAGSQTALDHYLTNLSTMPLMAVVDSVSFTSGSGNGPTAQIVIETFTRAA